MGWPKGKPRKAAVNNLEESRSSLVAESQAPALSESGDIGVAPDQAASAPAYPADWHPGMLLNVRNTGADYTITLYPEEYDPRYPSRALHFTNPGEAQNFVSKWYARESSNPLAR